MAKTKKHVTTIAKDSYPTIKTALDILRNDSGADTLGSYTVHGYKPADMMQIEKALSKLGVKSLPAFVCPQDDEAEDMIIKQPALGPAHKFLESCFEGKNSKLFWYDPHPRARSPLDRLRHHVTGAVERGESEPITEQRAKGKAKGSKGTRHKLYTVKDDPSEMGAIRDTDLILRKVDDVWYVYHQTGGCQEILEEKGNSLLKTMYPGNNLDDII